MSDDDAIDLVGSVGPLDPVVVALREFLHRSGAVRAVAVVGRDPGESPAVIDCARLTPIEVDLGDRIVHLPHAIELDAEPPPLPDVRQAPLAITARADGSEPIVLALGEEEFPMEPGWP